MKAHEVVEIEFHSFNLCARRRWARSGTVGWGTALQAGRSQVRYLMVSLKFFLDIILPAVLWPWGWLSLWQKWVPGIFPEGKGAEGWQSYHLHVPTVWNLGASTSWNPQGLSRPVRGCFTFTRRRWLVPQLFYPLCEPSLHTEKEDGWALEPIWMFNLEQTLSSSPKCPDWLWLSGGFSPHGQSSKGMKLTTHIHPVPWSRINGDIHLLQCVPSWCAL